MQVPLAHYIEDSPSALVVCLGLGVSAVTTFFAAAFALAKCMDRVKDNRRNKEEEQERLKPKMRQNASSTDTNEEWM